MKAYIAGPMRGYEKFNFPAFDAARDFLVGHDWDIVSPADLDRQEGFDEASAEEYDFDVAAALKRDFLAICDVEAIIFLPGWEHSKGANAERILGEALGLSFWLYIENEGDLPHLVFKTHGEMRELAARGMAADAPQAEERITNPATGGQKGRKRERFELLPWDQLAKVARLYAAGAAKYDDHNWRRGYDWSLSYGAMMRHAAAFWHGETIDPETHEPHMASVVFHALALLWFEEAHPELDDRYIVKRGEEANAEEAAGTAR